MLGGVGGGAGVDVDRADVGVGELGGERLHEPTRARGGTPARGGIARLAVDRQREVATAPGDGHEPAGAAEGRVAQRGEEPAGVVGRVGVSGAQVDQPVGGREGIEQRLGEVVARRLRQHLGVRTERGQAGGHGRGQGGALVGQDHEAAAGDGDPVGGRREQRQVDLVAHRGGGHVGTRFGVGGPLCRARLDAALAGRPAVLVDPGHDAAQRLDLGQLLDHRVVHGRGVDARQADGVGQLGQDLHALDRVDAQVGLEVEVGIEHVGRVARAVAHHTQHRRQQRLTRQHGSRRCLRSGSCRHLCGVGVVVDPGHDAAQRLDLGQLLDHRVVHGRGVDARQADGVGQLAEDLDALDRVDAQVGLEVEVGIEHVGRVAGAVAHDPQHRRQQRLTRQHGSRRRLWSSSGPDRRGRRDGRCDGGRLDDRAQVGRGTRSGAEVAEHDVALGRDQLADAAEVLEHRAVGLAAGSDGRSGRGQADDGSSVGGLQRVGHRRTARVADEVAVDRPAGDWRRQGADVEHARPLVEEQRRVDGHARGGQRADGQQQAADAVLARRVARDGRVGPIAQDLADQLGEHPTGTGLDEHPDAGRVHAPRSARRSAPGWPPARPAGPGSRPARRGRAAPVVFDHTGHAGRRHGDRVEALGEQRGRRRR